MTDNTNTTPILAPHDTNSLLYAAARDALDGFRIDTDKPAARLFAIAESISTAKAPAEVKAAAAEAFDSLPVIVASRGVTVPAAIIAGDFDLPEPGAAGFTVSLVGFKSLNLPDPQSPEGTSKRNGMWALAIYPAHTVEAAMESEQGQTWLAGIMAKEIGLVAFRGIRVTYGETTVADLNEAAFAMPCALTDYTDRTRATGESFATFNDLWQLFRDKLAASPTGAKILPSLPTKRADMLAAIRSANFAQVKFPRLEEAGLIVKIAQSFAAFVDQVREQAAQAGESLDYYGSDVERWLAGRETLDLVKAQTSDVDADELAAALSAFGA